jgi:parvulin-like peptidyl-prolyl isomerase
MTIIRRRSTRVAAVGLPVLLAAAALTGCDTSPGAAAVVGSQRISTHRLQQEVDRGLANPSAAQQLGADRAGFVRKELSRLVTNLLVAKAAQNNGVTASNSDIDQELASLAQQAGGQQQLEQSAASSGVPKPELRNFLYYYVLQQKIGAKLVAAVTVSPAQLQAAYNSQIDQFDQVDAAHILVKTKAQADSLLKQVKAHPSSFAALAKKYSLDTGSKANGGDLGFQPHSQFVKPFADAIFAAKVGSFTEVQSQFGWHVIHVIDRHTTTLAQATPQLKAAILGPQEEALVQSALTKAAEQLGVHVNPRYGVWDPKTTTVVAPPARGGLSSPAPTSAT